MKKLNPFGGALLILILIFATIYTVTQQTQRDDANYPQIQIAEDDAQSLNQGIKPTTLTEGHVNLSSSLAPFTIIYDKLCLVVSSSGFLYGEPPEAPIGILKAANNSAYHSVTWQLNKNLRVAAVTTSANNYYVLSGRSLKVIEQNENHSFYISLLGGFLSVLVLLGMYYSTKK